MWAVLVKRHCGASWAAARSCAEQLEHLNGLGGRPHITVQVLRHEVGTRPGVAGQFSLLEFSDATDASVVYPERFTSDLYLEKQSDARLFGDMCAHLQAQALPPDSTREFLADVVKTYLGTKFPAAP